VADAGHEFLGGDAGRPGAQRGGMVAQVVRPQPPGAPVVLTAAGQAADSVARRSGEVDVHAAKADVLARAEASEAGQEDEGRYRGPIAPVSSKTSDVGTIGRSAAFSWPPPRMRNGFSRTTSSASAASGVGSGSHADVERALVLGGSVAGILAARVLADHADEVVVVDRDDLADGPDERKGVAQGSHVHGLLGRGLEEMERLFPGITAELAADGGEIADPGIDLHWYVTGARKPPAGIGNGIACTRPFLEAHLRRRLTALPGVTMVRGRVDRLTATDGKVDGAVIEGAAEATEGERLSGDLVVDCSGRSSRADAWLGALGYEAPPRRSVKVELAYATRLFPRQPEDRLGGGRGILSVTE
jgi:hypothetical protein